MTSESPSPSTHESTPKDHHRRGDGDDNADDEVLYPCLHHLESSKSFLILCALEDLVEAYDEHGDQGDHEDDVGKMTFPYRLQIYPRVHGPNGIEKVHRLGKSPVLTVGPTSSPSSSTSATTTVTTTIPDRRVLSEARLILQYLYERYAEPVGRWKPSSTEDLDRDTFFQEFVNCSLLSKVDFVLVSELPSTVYPWNLRHLAGLFNYPFRWHFGKDLDVLFRYVEDSLSETKPWFGGTSRGPSDFLAIFPMDMASQRGYFAPSKYPKLQNWLDRIHDLPGYKRALEKGGKYNLKTFR